MAKKLFNLFVRFSINCWQIEATIWEQKKHPDTSYYNHEIPGALQRAVSKMLRLDGIGGGSAKIYNEITRWLHLCFVLWRWSTLA
jgi:hypothetical protein